MSFSDHAVVWLHIVAAVFTVGPGTAAIMATPRYIRKRDVVVLGYLNRATEIYSIGSLLVLVFGLIAAQLLHDFSKPWISASITLYAVAVVLLVLILRDQRKAMTAVAAAGPVADATGRSDHPNETGADSEAADGDQPDGTRVQAEVKTAMVEQGRIAMMSGIVALIWLAILVLMVWGAS
jgi:Ca2+/Na+ antiporter